jgi:ribosomal protein S25
MQICPSSLEKKKGDCEILIFTAESNPRTQSRAHRTPRSFAADHQQKVKKKKKTTKVSKTHGFPISQELLDKLKNPHQHVQIYRYTELIIIEKQDWKTGITEQFLTDMVTRSVVYSYLTLVHLDFHF